MSRTQLLWQLRAGCRGPPERRHRRRRHRRAGRTDFAAQRPVTIAFISRRARTSSGVRDGEDDGRGDDGPRGDDDHADDLHHELGAGEPLHRNGSRGGRRHGNLDLLLVGTGVTVALTATSFLLGFLLGFPSGAVEVYGRGPLKRAVETAGVVLRGTPLLVIIIQRLGLSVSSSAFVTATIALGLRSAA